MRKLLLLVIFVAAVLKGLTIDDVFIGVRAVDKDGNRSPVRTPEERLP